MRWTAPRRVESLSLLQCSSARRVACPRMLPVIRRGPVLLDKVNELSRVAATSALIRRSLNETLPWRLAQPSRREEIKHGYRMHRINAGRSHCLWRSNSYPVHPVYPCLNSSVVPLNRARKSKKPGICKGTFPLAKLHRRCCISICFFRAARNAGAPTFCGGDGVQKSCFQKSTWVKSP
jgi:hypothetical protein